MLRTPKASSEASGGSAIGALSTTWWGRATPIAQGTVRGGTLIEEQGTAYLADIDTDGEEARTLTPLQAAATT